MTRAARAPRPDGTLTTRAAITRYAVDHDLELVFLEPAETFDPAIVGVIHGFQQEPAVLYDQTRVLTNLIASGMSHTAAEEWFECNTLGAYLGEATPRFLLPL